MYTPDLAPEVRESERQRFADFVCDQAYQSENAAALLENLESNLPKDFLTYAGKGTSRRVYRCPLDLVVKVQRDSYGDPQDDQEVEDRGGHRHTPEVLHFARRLSSLNEAHFARYWPYTMPRIYGWAIAIGVQERHASVIVCDACTPLDRFMPDTDGISISREDLAFDEEGYLHILDKRVYEDKRPSHLRTVAEVFGADIALPTEIWPANIGVDSKGQHVFMDAGGFRISRLFCLNRWTYTPHSMTSNDPRQQCQPTIEQTRAYWSNLYYRYLGERLQTLPSSEAA